MRVLGIDPGLRLTGFGCVEGDPHRPSIVDAGVFRLKAPAPGEPLGVRLDELERDLDALLGRVTPGLVAVEGLFAHYKHPETAIKMAHARGVILLAIHRRGIELAELKPAEVKKSMTGSGRAGKAQVQDAVARVFGLGEVPEPADIADALAIGLTAMSRHAAAR